MRKIYRVGTLLALGSLLITPTLYAQKSQSAVKRQIMASNGTPALIEFNEEQNTNLRQAQSKEVLRAYLNLSNQEDMLFKQANSDELGYTHEVFQQHYKGIPVEYGTYNVHSKNGQILAINGEIKQIGAISTSPGLDEISARERALAFIGANSYMWQNPQQEAALKSIEGNNKATYFPEGKLVIIKDGRKLAKGQEDRQVLAYKFNIYAELPLRRTWVYIDAQTGKVVHTDEIIKHAAANGTLTTRYSGTQSSTTDSYNGSFRLRDYTRGNGVETYDMNNGTNYGSAVDFVDNDNNWTSAEWNNSAKDNAALDAHWAAQMTYDYFMNKHNRNSYNGNGAAIKSYVHYSSNYENAFWNGSVMTYGDGASRFEPLTSLDVGAHEIGHAVCSSTANLVYSYESGAMNEGFSDIWAAAVEYYAAPNKDTWLIGEDIDKQRPSLRSMSNPKAEGQPDTYKGTNWYTGSGDNGGVHYNSGVLNHWFYILSVGKSGTNDIGISYNVSAIGIDKAAKIAYRTEAVYLSSNSQYADARTYAIKSAEDLYGVGSNEVIQTTNAWNAVGIGGKYGEISYCSSQGNNSSYEWIASVKIGSFTKTSGAASYSDFTGTTVTLAPGSAYSVTLTPGFSGSTYNEYWKIWIDYNKDGDFDDSGELAFDGGGLISSTETGTMNISSSANGTTRMRVSMKYNGAQSQCESFSYGEVEDYTVSFGGTPPPPPTCDIPTGRSTSSITTSSATANWGAISGAASYNIRYRASGTTSWSTTSSNSTSRNLTGLNSNTAYEWQVQTVCSSGTSSWSASSAFTTLNITVTYCTSKGNNSSYEWIDLVRFGGIDRTSGNDGGYYNGTSQVGTAARGGSQTIYISAGFSSSSYTEYWRVYIDFNGDGDFTDSGEQVVSGSSSSSSTLSATINIPATANLGTTRMRVSMKYNAYQNSCESFTYGEVEDYTVNITSSLAESADTPIIADAKTLADIEHGGALFYPNPANKQLNFTGGIINGSVKILSVNGAVVLEKAINGNNRTIAVESLPVGLYLIKLNDGQKEITQKFLKE